MYSFVDQQTNFFHFGTVATKLSERIKRHKQGCGFLNFFNLNFIQFKFSMMIELINY